MIKSQLITNNTLQLLKEVSKFLDWFKKWDYADTLNKIRIQKRKKKVY